MADKPSETHPKIDFSTFIFSLGSAGLIQLGVTPNPLTKKMEKDLTQAKQNIELLALLKEKTAGNLTDDETKLIDNLLHTLRMKYVEETESKS